MQRVMIIGQPGSGKSTLARQLGEKTFLPVIHADHIHWRPGWVERDRAEKRHLTLEAIKRPAWIFEGGYSATWPQRLARADTLIWLDLPLGLRLRRVIWRTLRHYGTTRPDMQRGCPERFNAGFLAYIWRTRRLARIGMRALFDTAPADKARYHFTSARQVNAFLSHLGAALSVGNLGISHR